MDDRMTLGGEVPARPTSPEARDLVPGHRGTRTTEATSTSTVTAVEP